MKITILCSSDFHPITPYLREWSLKHGKYKIEIVKDIKELTSGDLLFLVSCSEILSASERLNYSKALVIHASDVPQGRGWSPHIWQILNGATDIVITLLEAEDQVDTGAIWKQIMLHLPKNALWDEINHLIFEAELQLMDFAVENFAIVNPFPQSTNSDATYYRKRTPADSQIDPTKSIEEQFDLIRVCDPKRFPAYFQLRGKKYIIRLETA
jgi:methionyl-tRNA formyltransferase